MPDPARSFPYRTPPELRGGLATRPDVLIVGAGPVGLAAAVDCALRGLTCVVLDDSDRVSTGSRAICWAKRTLEIFDRLGVGERVVEKGVTWKVGRLFHREAEVYSFDLLPEASHKMPAFVNLQQHYVERYLVERCADFPDAIGLRWRNRVTDVATVADSARATVETPDGAYTIEADYLLACDGARSSVRAMLGLALKGRDFEERFLIADVEMTADMPAERWFWFAPPFHAGQSALLHKQPDDIYRIDLQLGPDADPQEERQPAKVRPRIAAMLGHENFALDWVSVYAFRCARLARFVHGRIVFAGDAAHVVSPFGARGGNGGVHDVDNLVWKLAAVVKGEAPASLLESYDEERGRGADENIRHSSRATAFMTPRTAAERHFRDGALRLAATYDFARRMVNSGRLSVPCSLAGLRLQTPQTEPLDGGIPVGDACLDAPVGAGWLLDTLGNGFTLLTVGGGADGLPIGNTSRDMPSRNVPAKGEVAARYGDGLTYLVRPDQHVAARWREPSAEAVRSAHRRALGRATAHASTHASAHVRDPT